MDKSQAQQKILRLRNEINQHDYQYYVLAQPSISDYEYDMLMKQLEALEAEFPELASDDSPSKRVSGEPTKNFRTVPHRKPMLSLSNCWTISRIAARCSMTSNSR